MKNADTTTVVEVFHLPTAPVKNKVEQSILLDKYQARGRVHVVIVPHTPRCPTK